MLLSSPNCVDLPLLRNLKSAIWLHDKLVLLNSVSFRCSVWTSLDQPQSSRTRCLTTAHLLTILSLSSLFADQSFLNTHVKFGFYTYLNLRRLIWICHRRNSRLFTRSISHHVLLASYLLGLIEPDATFILRVVVEPHLLPSILRLEMVRGWGGHGVDLIWPTLLELLHLNLVQVLLLLQIKLKSAVASHGWQIVAISHSSWLAMRLGLLPWMVGDNIEVGSLNILHFSVLSLITCFFILSLSIF
jgi:hypothetical protein